MILRGIIIGVVVSAPMGPVGIYIIQRTLDKGRLSGFYTGVGAAVSDLIYCLLTGFGLSFIEEFINRHRSPIQLLGSIVLIFFGIWLIRKTPDGGAIAADADHGAPSREGDVLKGFALTFSNPLILFLIIGLFAQFNFVIEGMKFYHYLLGFIGIIGGALGWWWLVTHFVDKLRGHFTQRTMKRINMAIGVIILVFAGVGIYSSASSLLAARVEPVLKPGLTKSVEFRVSDPSMKGWTCSFPCRGDSTLSLEVSPDKQADPFGDRSVDVLSVRVVERPSGLVIGETVVSEGIDPYRGANSWRIVRAGNGWNIFAGNREWRHVLSFATGLLPTGEPSVSSRGATPVETTMIHIESAPVGHQGLTEADIFSALADSGIKAMDIAGVYSMLDYEHDDTYALIGGSYRLAVVPSGEGYEVYYLGGAQANGGEWQTGRLKGRLRPTAFPTVFDVEWCDAEGEWMLRDVQAEHDALAKTLTVKFPYQSATIRLRKE